MPSVDEFDWDFILLRDDAVEEEEETETEEG